MKINEVNQLIAEMSSYIGKGTGVFHIDDIIAVPFEEEEKLEFIKAIRLGKSYLYAGDEWSFAALVTTTGNQSMYLTYERLKQHISDGLKSS